MATTVETKIYPGDQVFVTTPYPTQGQIPMQPMANPAYQPQPMANPPYAPKPTIVNLQPSEPGAFRLNAKIVFRLGVCTVVFGFLALIFGMFATILFGSLDYNVASGGIWGGAIIIASGIIAIVSSRKPQNRGWNWTNLALHCFTLAVCIGVLALCGFSLDYYDVCVRRYFHRYTNYNKNWNYPGQKLFNKNCPSDKDGAIAIHSLIVVLICVQLGISIAIIILASRAYPSCRNYQCDCGSEPGYNTRSRNQSFHNQSFETGYATMSPNVQPIPSGQILYMMTPVAVTTQHPQYGAVNSIPQATFVMNS